MNYLQWDNCIGGGTKDRSVVLILFAPTDIGHTITLRFCVLHFLFKSELTAKVLLILQLQKYSD